MILIGTPHTRNSGYYLSDNRAAGDGKREADIRTCTHCQAIIKMQAWKDEGAFCRECFAPICVNCGTEMKATGVCVPFMKRIDLFTDTLVKYQQHLKIAGLEPKSPPKILITGL